SGARDRNRLLPISTSLKCQSRNKPTLVSRSIFRVRPRPGCGPVDRFHETNQRMEFPEDYFGRSKTIADGAGSKAARRDLGIGDGLSRSDPVFRQSGDFLPSLLVELGVSLCDGADGCRDLAIGLPECTAGRDELSIGHDTMMMVVGRLDEILRDLSPRLTHLIDKPLLLLERNLAVRRIRHHQDSHGAARRQK